MSKLSSLKLIQKGLFNFLSTLSAGIGVIFLRKYVYLIDIVVDKVFFISINRYSFMGCWDRFWGVYIYHSSAEEKQSKTRNFINIHKT